jgi:hypothetical protein
MSGALVRTLALASFALALLASPAAADEQADRAAAIAAATRKADMWLRDMDEHRYSQGWNDSATVVKTGRTEQSWIQEIAGPREALGKPVMRELKRADFSTRVRGAPEGSYVTAVYLTKFTNIPLANEIVLLDLENGEWRIGGYSIEEAEPSDAGPSPQPKAKE